MPAMRSGKVVEARTERVDEKQRKNERNPNGKADRDGRV